MSDNEFENEYSEDGFWEKVKNYARSAGERVVELSLNLYYAANDPATAIWAKTTIYGAPGYYISPSDARYRTPLSPVTIRLYEICCHRFSLSRSGFRCCPG
jgi:hypothetical protein